MLREPTKTCLLLAWTAAVCVCLWLLDFPKPLIDDLAYCNAAVHLAGGGDLSNPLLARYQLPGHYFFLAPPLHSYALAGWLKLFGVSARAMTGFPVTMYFVTALSTIAFLRRLRTPALILWLVPLGVSTSLLSAGLRPEPFAIALSMAGFALFLCGPKHPISRVAAFSFLFLGAAAAPRMTVFAAALILYALVEIYATRSPAPFRNQWRLWAPPALGLGLAGGAFLALIQFRLEEFWQTFHFVSKAVTAGKLTRLINYLNENPFLNNAQFPLVLFTAALILFAWPPERSAFKRLTLFLIAAFPLVTLIGGLGAGSLWFIVLILLVLASAILNQSPALGPKLKPALCLALLLANVEVPVTAYGLLRGKIDRDRGPQLAEAQALRSFAGHTVLVDSWVARYAFGYDLPPDFLDVNFAAPFPQHFAFDARQPGDIYLIGPETVQGLKECSMLDLPVPTWVPFGLPNRRFTVQPRRIYVIHADDCTPRRAR